MVTSGKRQWRNQEIRRTRDCTISANVGVSFEGSLYRSTLQKKKRSTSKDADPELNLQVPPFSLSSSVSTWQQKSSAGMVSLIHPAPHTWTQMKLDQFAADSGGVISSCMAKLAKCTPSFTACFPFIFPSVFTMDHEIKWMEKIWEMVCLVWQ